MMIMVKREITYTRKKGGKIIALCNPGMTWSPLDEDMAITHIEFNIHSYYVNFPDLGPIPIIVLQDENGRYLGTDPNVTNHNLLDDLPDC